METDETRLTAPSNDPLFEAGLKIIERLEKNGFKAVFAGGCVRDRILGLNPKDYDIATDASPEDVEEIFSYTVPVGKAFGVVIVVIDGKEFDVARFRKDEDYEDGRRPTDVSYSSPKEDVFRRDFTVNGLLWDPLEEKVIDYVNGVNDINNQVIRTIGDPEERFGEDYLRMLRAPRFAAQLGFRIERETVSAIKKHADRILQISSERILEELKYLFASDNPDRGLKEMIRLDLVRHLFPEVAALEEISQGGEDGEETVLEHTIRVMENWSERKMGSQPDNSVSTEEDDDQTDQAQEKDVMKGFSILFHDIARPDSEEPERELPENDLSSETRDLSEEILDRLRSSNAVKQGVGWCVGHFRTLLEPEHLSLAQKKQYMAHKNWPVLKCLIRSVAEVTSEVDVDSVHSLIDLEESLEKEEINPPPLITGDDLKEMGLCPGPIFGDLLDEVRTAQLNNELNSRAEALDYVEDLLDDSA